MKILGYILSFLLFGFIAWQFYSAYSNKKFENKEHQFLGSISYVNFKIYNQYTLASVKMKGKSLNDANGKFSLLANYIFGGNSDKKQIPMTSPVIYNMSNQIFKSNPDNKFLFDLLQKICIKNEKYYLIDKISFRKGLLSDDIKTFFTSLVSHYHASKLYYINRDITYNSFLTVVRHVCKANEVRFISKIKYDKSKYEIIYYVYF